MDERTRRLSDLLRDAAEVHHVVYRITDGADDDWASFYADGLIEHSELPDALGGAPTRSGARASAPTRTSHAPTATIQPIANHLERKRPAALLTGGLQRLPAARQAARVPTRRLTRRRPAGGRGGGCR